MVAVIRKVSEVLMQAFSYPGALGHTIQNTATPLKRVTAPVSNVIAKVPKVGPIMSSYGGGTIILGLLAVYAVLTVVRMVLL